MGGILYISSISVFQSPKYLELLYITELFSKDPKKHQIIA